MNRPSDPEYREVMPAIEKLVSEHKSTLIAGDPQLNICDQSVMVRKLLKSNRIDNLNTFSLYDFSSHSLQLIDCVVSVPAGNVPGSLEKAQACELCLISARAKRAGKIYPCTLARLGETARGAPKIRDHSEFKKAHTFLSSRPLCPINRELKPGRRQQK